MSLQSVVAADGDIAEYLSHCVTKDGYFVSGIRVKGLQDLREENKNLTPGSQIRPHGYLVIGSSIGGNAVVFSTTGDVLWADHTSYNNPNEIKFENRATGAWEYVPWSAANLRRSMVHLSSSIETFMLDLIAGKLTAQLDKLD